MPRQPNNTDAIRWAISRTGGIRGKLLSGTLLQLVSTATQIAGILLPVRLLGRAQDPWTGMDSILLTASVTTLAASALAGYFARRLIVDSIVEFESHLATAVLNEGQRRARKGEPADVGGAVALSMTARLVAKLLDAIVRMAIPIGIVVTAGVVLGFVAPWLLALAMIVIVVALPLVRRLNARSSRSGDSLSARARADALERQTMLRSSHEPLEDSHGVQQRSIGPAMREHLAGYRERLLLAQRSLLTSGFQYAALVVGGVTLVRLTLLGGDPLEDLSSVAVILILLRYLGNAITRASKELTVIALYAGAAHRVRAYIEEGARPSASPPLGEDFDA